jgi:MoxR-like ATPase
MAEIAFQIEEPRTTSEVRQNFRSLMDEATQHPGRITRFGPHRRAEVALMSEATLRALLQQVRDLEHDLVAARANAIMAAGGPSVSAEDVEGAGYRPPSAEEAAASAAAFRAAATA